MKIVFDVLVPAVILLYACLIMIAAAFRPRALSGRAFTPDWRLPWKSYAMGRVASFLFGLLFASTCGYVLARNFGWLGA